MAIQKPMAALHRLTAERLLGVDLAADPSEVSPQRSPHAVNMLRTVPGCVEKRPGFQQMAAYDGAIHGCYELNGVQILHAGRSLYANGSRLHGALADARSRGYCLGGCLYLLDGSEFWQVYPSGNSFAVQPVSKPASIARHSNIDIIFFILLPPCTR